MFLIYLTNTISHNFHEKNIPTIARPIQMSQELMDTCKAEIEDLLKKGIIQNSRSPWSSPAFYVQKNAEIERGVPRLVINYKPLNKVLEWISYKKVEEQLACKSFQNEIKKFEEKLKQEVCFDLPTAFWH